MKQAAIIHYPKNYGGRQWRKDVTDTVRRVDDKAQVAAERPIVTPSKKNKRRWCRGKVGIEHQPEWTTVEGWDDRPLYKLQVCQTCGRHLDYDFGILERRFSSASRSA